MADKSLTLDQFRTLGKDNWWLQLTGLKVSPVYGYFLRRPTERIPYAFPARIFRTSLDSFQSSM